MEKIKVGEKYGRLTVLENHHPKDEVLCICECGNLKIARASNVYHGGTKSCGCLFNEGNNLKHGGKGTRLYQIWKSMRERCNTPTCRIYKYYGAKGIKICKEWEDFIAFREWAITNGYSDNLTIDRIDVFGNYEPSNCRWATYKEQANNTTKNHRVEFNGKNLTLSEWSEITGIKMQTIWGRLKRGWSVSDALTKEVKA
jgi:hypothetical protein